MIYVIVVTILFAGYYAVTIYKDLHVNRKSENPAEEVFDLGSMQEDVAVPVSETEQGFQVGESENEMPGDEEGTGDDNATGEERGTDSPNAAEEKVKQISENMEETGVQSEVALNEIEFHEFILSESKRNMLFRDDVPQTQPGPEPGEITI